MHVCDIFCELPRGNFNGGAVIVSTKERYHGAASVARASVIDDGLESVANFNAVFAIVGSEKKQGTGVVFFCANAKMFEEINSVIFDGAIVKRSNGDDGELRAGFLFELPAERFNALLGVLRDNAGEIGDVADGRNVVDVVSECGGYAEEEQEENAKA